jgi:hypothetical protein
MRLYKHSERARAPQTKTHWPPKPRTSAELYSLLAIEVRTRKGDGACCELAVVPRPLPCCAPQLLDRCAQADTRGLAQVHYRGAQKT